MHLCLFSSPFLLFSPISLMLSHHCYCFLLYFNFILLLIYYLLGILDSPTLYSSWFGPSFQPIHPLQYDWFDPHPWLAWQGTDLMHNHVLADVDQSYVDAVGCRSSGFPSSDQSEDSDYDTIWITHTNRIGSMSRKSCCSYIHIKLKHFFFYFVCIECDELFLRAVAVGNILKRLLTWKSMKDVFTAFAPWLS